MARILADLAAPSATNHHSMTSTQSSLWDFAVALYAQPGIEPLCLRLQDEHAANINVLIFACWLEIRQIQLDLPAALARVSDWDRDYVQTLRQLRRQMKQEFAGNLTDVATVRDQIKHAELLAEGQQLRWLEGLASTWSQSGGIAAGENLRIYLNHLQVPEATIAIVKARFGRYSL